MKKGGRRSPMIGFRKGKWRPRQMALWLYAMTGGWLLCSASAIGQDNVSTQKPGAPRSELPLSDDDPLTTMFQHAEWDRFWLSGQANFISQYHPTFTSPYEGKNSLSPQAQDATSRVLTLFTGWRATTTTEFLCDVQETGGNGLGQALGVGGFFNLDVVRNPTLSKAPRYRAADVAPNHPAEPQKSSRGPESFQSLPRTTRAPAGAPLRKIQPGRFL
jgi:hypothetical protein